MCKHVAAVLYGIGARLDLQPELLFSLRRVDAGGGTPVPICDPMLAFREGSWGSDGYILFSTLLSGVFRVAASGGTPWKVTAPDASHGELAYRWPQVIPGGRFLYWVEGSKPESSGVYAASLTRPSERVRLLTTASNAVYAPGVDGKGYLLWSRSGSLVAQQFDPHALQFAGDPQPIAEALNLTLQGQMNVAASANGLLLLGAFGEVTRLAWFGRTGKILRELGDPVDGIYMFRLSPDERQIAVQVSAAAIHDLWLLDAERGLLSRFTAGTAHSTHPIWSPDGRIILFTHLGSAKVFRKAANGLGDEQEVVQRPNSIYPNDWSGDGRWVLAREVAAGGKSALWVLPVTPNGKMQEGASPKPYLRTPFNVLNGRFSLEPSPRWVAYQSDESGKSEVYIDAFPEPHGKKRISTAGGTFPQWGAGGSELFYVSPDYKLMAVSLKFGADAVEPSAPRELFRLPVLGLSFFSPYEASRDDQRFLVLTSPDAPQSLTVIVNWPALMKKSAGVQ